MLTGAMLDQISGDRDIEKLDQGVGRDPQPKITAGMRNSGPKQKPGEEPRAQLNDSRFDIEFWQPVYLFCTALDASCRSRPKPEMVLQELRKRAAAPTAERRTIFRRERVMILGS